MLDMTMIPSPPVWWIRKPASSKSEAFETIRPIRNSLCAHLATYSSRHMRQLAPYPEIERFVRWLIEARSAIFLHA